MPNASIAAALFGLAVASVAVPAYAQAPPFVGEWHWNRAESSTAPGEPLPSAVVLTIAAAEPGRVQWNLAGTDAKGENHVQSYSGAGNGQPGPVTGAPDGTMAAFTVTASSMTAVYTNRDGSAEHTTCTVAADRKKMTCQGTDSDGKGHSSSFRDVYDRR